MKKATEKIVLTKTGAVNKSVINGLNNCKYDEVAKRIYTKSYRGSGRHITLGDYTHFVKDILKAQGYAFTQGNSAPRGGKEGDFIEMSRTAYNFIVSLKNA